MRQHLPAGDLLAGTHRNIGDCTFGGGRYWHFHLHRFQDQNTIARFDVVASLYEQADHLAGHLCLYGPFFDTRQTAGAGNQRFDAALRARDPAMGLRTRQALDALAEAAGLVPAACEVMPQDNRLLIWSKR